MGRATRWLKGLFGMNKKETSASSFHDRGNKKSLTFGHSLRRLHSRGISSNPTTTPPNISPVETAPLRMTSPLYGNATKEHNKQALAVAAATSEAAEAAVQLVRLTSRGRRTMFNCRSEVFAAITIQTTFRGYLARKAHRALKALVKVQALVRGFLVRKQTYVALHGMEALIRAQQNVIAQKSRGAILKSHQENCISRNLSRKSQEKFDNSRKKFKQESNNKRILAPFEPNVADFDRYFKVLEVDSEKTTTRSRRIKKCTTDFDRAYSRATSSPPPRWNPARASLSVGRSFRESDQWGHMMRGENKYSTAQISPVFTTSWGSNAPINQAKGECGDVYFRNEKENYPNYMVNKKSFNGKMRSQSVPRQRVDNFSGYESNETSLSLNEVIMESKSCQNGARMQKPCSSQAQGNINFKNLMMVKIGKSSNIDN